MPPACLPDADIAAVEAAVGLLGPWMDLGAARAILEACRAARAGDEACARYVRRLAGMLAS